MNGYIKEANRGGVHNRLYLDSSVRKKKQDNIEKQISITTDSTQKPRQRIEDLLLQKYAKSQAKINTLRTKQQIQEVQQLKPAPKINRISKQIVELREGIHNDSISLYTTKLLSGSRSASAIRIPPKQSFLSLMDLKMSEITGNCSGLIKVQENEESFDQEVNTITREFAMLKNTGQTEKDRELNDIREALFSKIREKETPKVKADVLNMNVLERNNYWLKEKNEKLNNKKEILNKQETIGCTFSPRLTPRIDLTHDNRKPSMPVANSYSQKYLNKPNCVKPKDDIQGKVEKNGIEKIMMYKSLSPHERTLSQGQSMTSLYKAKPLASYKK
ncbi:hypothetical protein SteCoe_14167 [Stentor coeruleus]|uniref:Uncharacterized protein n=1 Tax=Stentor coeruleus TaxID=5963 RepID=A0A1R2C6Q0_9CILI|nr:hypothetical protein SteCoe_14167 [Stentor coeruleus]